MPSQLSIYNGALAILGERKLGAVDENREPRYKLDDIWDNDFVDRILQMGQWNFAMRTVELQPSPDITPAFGYQYAFGKPDDFIRTMLVTYDEYYNRPITRYSDQGNFIYCDTDPIYLGYVSNDDQFGGDLSMWPPNVAEMAEHYMAYKVAPRISGLDVSDKRLARDWKMWLAEAKAVDAMEDPAKFPPKGGWARSRQGFRGSDNDRGNRSQLIG